MNCPAGIEYRPDWHFVSSIPFQETARRILPMYDVFTYRHKITGNWMVAHWIKRWEHMQELVCLGKEPVGSRKAVKKLELFRPSSEAEANRAANRQDLVLHEKRWRQTLQSEADEMDEHVRVVQRASARGAKRQSLGPWSKFQMAATGGLKRKQRKE